jgi:hypothetical protein
MYGYTHTKAQAPALPETKDFQSYSWNLLTEMVKLTTLTAISKNYMWLEVFWFPRLPVARRFNPPQKIF